SYLKLATDVSSRAMAEGKVTKLQEAINNPIKPEATYYEEFNSFLNSYLHSFIEGKSAQDELETAQAVAKLMLKNTKDKVGVDQVEFYSKLSVDAAKELLEARLETEDLSKVVAIDHFQDSINKLYKVKEVFVRHRATADAQIVSFLLAKFLSKAGNLQQARLEVDSQQNLAKEKHYLFNYAQQLLWDAQLNVLERKEQEVVRKLQESIDICQKIDAEKFALNPLLLISQVYVAAGEDQIAFVGSIEGLVNSLKQNHAAFSSQFLQNAGRAATGLDKPYLAIEYLETSVEVSEKEELWGYSSVLKANLAAVLAQHGNLKRAISLIEEAKSINLGKTTDLSSKKQQLMHINLYEGKIYGLAKLYTRSEAAYRSFIAMSEEFGYKNMLNIGQARKGLGEALLGQKRDREALEQLEMAQEELEKLQQGLHPKNKNPFLDYSFSGKDIEELIKLIQP
ncbi:MAG: hypothetical protein JNN15_21250, partial [Blastocatellia bacterium]|nr:hypothetical protein [Blastocatellia bacterium]